MKYRPQEHILNAPIEPDYGGHEFALRESKQNRYDRIQSGCTHEREHEKEKKALAVDEKLWPTRLSQMRKKMKKKTNDNNDKK